MCLVQAPLGGSGPADYVLGEGEPMDGRLPALCRAIARLVARRERGPLEGGRHSGLGGLARKASRAYWGQALSEHAAAIPVVGPRTFYLEARARPSRLRPFRRALGRYLGAYYGPNDGMVVTGDQALPGLGTSLGVLDAGHADLTRRFRAACAERRSRGALMQSIVMAVGRSGAGGG